MINPLVTITCLAIGFTLVILSVVHVVIAFKRHREPKQLWSHLIHAVICAAAACAMSWILSILEVKW